MVLIGKVSHQLPERQWQRFDQRRRRQDLHLLGQGRLLINVDDLQLVAVLQMHLAKFAKILDGTQGPRRLPGYIQPERIFLAVFDIRVDLQRSFLAVLLLVLVVPVLASIVHLGSIVHLASMFFLTSSPTKTRSVSDRSPMILRMGWGRLRTSVGMARIWSPCASCGVFTRSITWSSKRPSRCSLQIFLKFASAVSDLGV